MNGIPALAQVASRINEIRRTFSVPQSSGEFRQHLQEAQTAITAASTPPTVEAVTPTATDTLPVQAASEAPAAESTETSTTENTAVTAPPPPPEYVTLGGAPVDPGPAPNWAEGLPERAAPFVGFIEDIAEEMGLDPRLLAGLVWAESTFVPDAVSSAGAIGLAQLMPGTAAGLGVDPWDPEANLRGGATYLAQQIDRFGTLELGLAAYNAGPGRVLEHNGAPSYTHAYIDRVLGYFEQLGGTP